MIEVKSIVSEEFWESSLLRVDFAPFLQSWHMGNVHGSLGETFFRLGIFEDGSLVGLCLIIKVCAKRGWFLSLPYGPVLVLWKREYFENLLIHLKQLAFKEQCSFIKVAPFLPESSETNRLFAELGFIRSPLHLLAETLWVLDVEKSEDELLRGMKKNHRNLIRRAEKDGVIIKKTHDSSEVERFISLHHETSSRHQFMPYPDDYFREQVKFFSKRDQVLVFSAWHREELLACAIIMYYGNSGSYHHGASKTSKIPAGYLLQWEAIREAKKRKCKYYNFWGIYDGENTRHPFYGITHFKKGFGGYAVGLMHCHDLPLKYSYFMTYAIDTFRKFRRGFYHN